MNSFDTKSPEHSSFTSKAVTASGVVSLFVLAGAILFLAREFFLLIFAAILFAIFLTAAASLISRWTGWGQKTCLALFVLFLVSLSGLGLYLGGTMLVEQSREAVAGIQNNAAQLLKRIQELGVPLDISNLSTNVSGGQGLGFATKFFSSTFGFLTNLLFILVVGVFLASSPQSYIKGFSQLWPADMRDGVLKLLHRSGDTLRSWLMGQLVAMTLIGVATGTSLALLGVPAASALGLFAGLISFIPTIGATLAIIPALMMASQQGSGTVIAVLVIYGITQFLESNVATPLIQNQQVNLTAAVILGGQLFAGLLFGFLGVALITPLLAVAQLWLRLLYIPARDKNQSIRQYIDYALRNPSVLEPSVNS